MAAPLPSVIPLARAVLVFSPRFSTNSFAATPIRELRRSVWVAAIPWQWRLNVERSALVQQFAQPGVKIADREVKIFNSFHTPLKFAGFYIDGELAVQFAR